MPNILPRYVPHVDSNSKRPTWAVLAVGDLQPRKAPTEAHARRWAANLGGAVITHPDGREEVVNG